MVTYRVTHNNQIWHANLPWEGKDIGSW